jgi:hypothetical protein
MYVDDAPVSHSIYVLLQDADGRPSVFNAREVEIDVPVGALQLAAGKYSVTVVVVCGPNDTVLARHTGMCPFRVIGPEGRWAKVVRSAIPTVRASK